MDNWSSAEYHLPTRLSRRRCNSRFLTRCHRFLLITACKACLTIYRVLSRCPAGKPAFTIRLSASLMRLESFRIYSHGHTPCRHNPESARGILLSIFLTHFKKAISSCLHIQYRSALLPLFRAIAVDFRSAFECLKAFRW